jgi:hypothetical protein
MSPSVRLPLIELTQESQAALATIVAQLCNEHDGSLIGTFQPIPKAAV